MKRFIFLLLVLKLLIMGSAEASCLLGQTDFSNYVRARQRISFWLVNVITKAQIGLITLGETSWQRDPKSDQLTKAFVEFENELRVDMKVGLSTFQLENLGMRRGLAKSIVSDLVFVHRIEEIIPGIKHVESKCQDSSAKICVDSVRAILKKFNLSSVAEERILTTNNKKHCEF